MCVCVCARARAHACVHAHACEERERERERIHVLFLPQAHSDLVVCMLLSPDHQFIVTCGYGGEVKLWSSDGWIPLAETITPMRSLFYVSSVFYSYLRWRWCCV